MPPLLSFEFFPPKNENAATRLHEAAAALSAWNPRFISITCGADGSALEGTFAVVQALRASHPTLAVAPHLPMSRASRPTLRQSLQQYKQLGVRQVVAIRGDAPKIPTAAEGADFYPSTVEFVEDLAHGFGLQPIVAAYPDVHPLAQSPQQDLDHLRRKVEAGATAAITQFFFQAETFLRFRDTVRAAGIAIPLTPGIMPLHDLKQVLNFAKGCGTHIPDGFSEQFADAEKDPHGYFEQASRHTVALCDRLRLEGVDGFHFYTLNRSAMVQAICENLKLQPRKPVAG